VARTTLEEVASRAFEHRGLALTGGDLV